MSTYIKGINALYLLLFGNIFLWNTLYAQDGNLPAMVLTGTVENQRSFRDLCKTCSEKSPTFKNIFNQARIQSLPITVGRSFLSSGGLFGAFKTGIEPHKIDLDHIERMPVIRMDARRNYSRAGNLPNWGSTQCTMLGHELSEALYAFENKTADFLLSHQHAIRMENRIRRDLQLVGCREWQNYPKNEAEIPHGNHFDALVFFGGHVHRIHKDFYADGFYITYEFGTPRKCMVSHFDP